MKNGVIIINKEIGPTSQGVVNRVKRLLGASKAGHTGTLDPMATGVLPVLIERGVKASEFMLSSDKHYVATLLLGVTTDTEDVTGEILTESDNIPDEAEVLGAVSSFVGSYLQTPPMYSALKKDGVRLYELARQGIEVERQERECEIFKLEISQLSENEFSLFTECSAGTYIRSLIGDIGECLNTGATMTSLNRTFACGISEDECITLDELENYRDNNELEKIIVPVDKMLMSYPDVTVTKAQGVRFKNGGELLKGRIKGTVPQGLVRVYCENEFLGLGESLPESENLTVKRVYVER